MKNSVRELSQEDMERVCGGLLPFLAAAAARSVVRYGVTRAATAYSVYQAANYYK